MQSRFLIVYNKWILTDWHYGDMTLEFPNEWYTVLRVYDVFQMLKMRERDSAAVVEKLKGNPKYMGASLTHGHAHFSSKCGFMVGFGKPKLCTKFEVPSFSHCVNIEVNQKYSVAPLAQRHVHFFLQVWFYDGACQIQAEYQIWSR